MALTLGRYCPSISLNSKNKANRNGPQLPATRCLPACCRRSTWVPRSNVAVRTIVVSRTPPMVGSMAKRKSSHIRCRKVITPDPDMSKATISSSNEMMKANRAPTSTPRRTSGGVTCRNEEPEAGPRWQSRCLGSKRGRTGPVARRRCLSGWVYTPGSRLMSKSRSPARQRMMCLHQPLQPFRQHVRVDLRRGDIRMPQQQLQAAQVGAVRQQVRRK